MFQRLALFMDNLSAHKTIKVKELLSRLGIEYIFNVPYQPDFNPCESCISKIKNNYKRKKLNMLLNEE